MWPFATHSQSNQKANAKAQPKSSRKKLWQKEETPPPHSSGVRSQGRPERDAEELGSPCTEAKILKIFNGTGN